MKHTFVICAYKESEYLEECIKSLLNQTVKSEIKICTSTPNNHIDSLAQKYKIEVCVNTKEHGITQDWNFAYKQANTPYVTIAHQDDVYLPEYTEKILKKIGKKDNVLICFSGYQEIRNGKFENTNKLLKIKKLMLAPLKLEVFEKNIFVRRRILSLGNPICCPAVTFVKTNLPEEVFHHKYRSNEDWEAWEMLSKRKGKFVYIDEQLVGHRIHQDSETSKIIGDNARTIEDLDMFKKFWPVPVAKFIAKVYAGSEKSNSVE